MENQSSVQQSSSFQWKWVWVGVLVGAGLIAAFVALVDSVFHNPFIPPLIGSLCFIVTGIIVGYKSPGVTIREASVAGIILMVFSLFILTFGVDLTLPAGYWIFSFVLSFFFSMLGAWVGEQLQGTLPGSSNEGGKISLPWIAVGVVIGFLLNNFSVFLLFAIFRFGVTQILISLGISFVLTGVITGYRSPTVTIREAVAAGIALVIVDFLLVYLGFNQWLPIWYLVVGLIASFFFNLLGSWLGEQLQIRASRQATPVQSN